MRTFTCVIDGKTEKPKQYFHPVCYRDAEYQRQKNNGVVFKSECTAFDYITVGGIPGIFTSRVHKIVNKYYRIRKKIGSFIIGNPKYGRGIYICTPTGFMTEEQREKFWRAEKLFREAGIRFDTGMSCDGGRDWEFDWSPHGLFCICKRCGYDTRKHVKKYHEEREKEHKDCDGWACSICNNPESHQACLERGF